MNTNIKNNIAVILTAAFAAMGMGGVAYAQDAVTYLDWNSGSKSLEAKQCTEYTVIDKTMLAASNYTLAGGWYVVAGNVSDDHEISLDGDVHVILADGSEWRQILVDGEGPAIGVSRNDNDGTSSITIYGQAQGTGRLTAHGGSSRMGIGGVWNYGICSVTINGGVITASADECGFGIAGRVTINGGVVTATGGNNAVGICGGGTEETGWVTINGGVVTAKGGNYAAGIGGPNFGSAGRLTVNGGTLTATGGRYSDSAGINGQVTITGGQVNASGDSWGIVGALEVSGGNVAAYGSSVGCLGVNGSLTASAGLGIQYGSYTNRLHMLSATDFSQGRFEAVTNSQFVHIGTPVRLTVPSVANCANAAFFGDFRIQDDSGSYDVMSGDVVRVYFVPNAGFSLDSSFVNPLTKTVVADTTLSGGDLPSVSSGQPAVNYWAWNETTCELEGQTCTAYEEYFFQDRLEDGKWYVVNCVLPTRHDTLSVEGSAHLILCDEANLTVKASGEDPSIAVKAISNAGGTTVTNALSVYGQANGTGALVADASGSWGAGIGGDYYADGGTLTIHGGTVTAIGNENASAIGGRWGAVGAVTINGGLVTATTEGWSSAGIEGHEVYINGGEIMAIGGGASVGVKANGGVGCLRLADGVPFAITVGANGLATGVLKQEFAANFQNYRYVHIQKGKTVLVIDDQLGLSEVVSNGTSEVAAAYHDGLRRTWIVSAGETLNVLYGPWDCFEWDGEPTGNPRMLEMTDSVALHAADFPAVRRVRMDVDYYAWDEASGAVVGPFTTNAVVVDFSLEAFTSDWYVVNHDTTNATGGITVSGDARLILGDGAKLVVTGRDRAAGVEVEVVGNDDGTATTNSLAIYGQQLNTGVLEAMGDTYAAGIGGSENATGGVVTVSGGMVTAKGGHNGAGIGGGENGDGGVVTINAGTVSAEGGYSGAGIGGGRYGDGGVVTINGGEVTTLGRSGAGIGGGYEADGKVLTINGGTVTATGESCSAGIGGGENGNGGVVTINAGTVSAEGGERSAGIGGGTDGSGCALTINGGKVTALGGQYMVEHERYRTAGIGAGFQTAEDSLDVGTFTLGSRTTAKILVANYILSQGDVEEVIYEDFPIWQPKSWVEVTIIERPESSEPLGSAANPWYVGVTGRANSVQAYTNGEGQVIVTGTGVPMAIAAGEEPWAGADITKIIVPSRRGDTFKQAWPGSAALIADGSLEVEYYAWNGEMVAGPFSTNALPVTADMTTLDDGWYVVTGRVEIAAQENYMSGLAVNGDVHLILMDDVADLTVSSLNGMPGIRVARGYYDEDSSFVDSSDSLSIYGQAKGTGRLTSIGDYAAGIGGVSYGEVGDITIHGGVVTATGDSYAAGIGGGDYSTGGNVTVNGGIVSATGFSGGAGIGGGRNGDGCNVTVNGGEIIAISMPYEDGEITNGCAIGRGSVSSPEAHLPEAGAFALNSANAHIYASTKPSGLGAAEVMAGDYLTWEPKCRVHIVPAALPLGSFENAWRVGADPVDSLLAYTNGENQVFVIGTGDPKPFDVGGEPWKDLPVTVVFVPGWREEEFKEIWTGSSEIIDDRVIEADYFVRNGESLAGPFTTNALVVTADLADFADGRWYVATDRVEVVREQYEKSGIAVNGDAHLILADDTSDLTVRSGEKGAGIGVTVRSNDDGTVTTNSLVIYGQAKGTGRLTAIGYYGAGIGGDQKSACGPVTVNGGVVTASSSAGAGIGCGYKGQGGVVTIVGGTVMAQGGEQAAGIGGCYKGESGIVTIVGGTVSALGGIYGAGIGGGASVNGGVVTINGGSIEARGGFCGAGIGGGMQASGGEVVINGGSVMAYGGVEAAGIGGSVMANGGTVTINGGTVLAVSCSEYQGIVGGGGAGIGGGAMGNGAEVVIHGGEVTAIAFQLAVSGQVLQGDGIGAGGALSGSSTELGSFTLDYPGAKIYAGMDTNGVEVAEVQSADYSVWHTNCYVKIMAGAPPAAPEGSPENPWKVGADGQEDTVLAYTNGNGQVIVTGNGTPKTFSAGEEPWVGANPSITEIIVPTGRGAEFKSIWTSFAGLITDGTVEAVETNYYAWNGTEVTGPFTTNAIPVTAEMATLESGWYVVQGEITMPDHGLVVNGDVHLILADGAELVVTGAYAKAGIAVTIEGTVTNSLSVYGQRTGSGALTVVGGVQSAGIGGVQTSTPGLSYGNIYFHGGRISVKALAISSGAHYSGAAIGGCYYAENHGKIVYYGGTVVAQAGAIETSPKTVYASAIGGGTSSYSGNVNRCAPGSFEVGDGVPATILAGGSAMSTSSVRAENFGTWTVQPYVKIKISEWALLQNALTNDAAASLTCEAFEHTYADGTNFVKLLADITANTNVDTRMLIGTNSIAVLDLNGCTLDRGLAELEDEEGIDDGHVISVFGQLTVTDASGAHDGKITGGYGHDCACISVGEKAKDGSWTGRFVLENGFISGNNSSHEDDGGAGGVTVDNGEFLMLGGAIVNNFGLYGGGVGSHAEASLESGIFRIDLRGGVIAGNGGGLAGAVYSAICDSEAVTVGGNVVITNNTAQYVGGLFVSGLTVGGSPVIRDNEGDMAANLLVLEAGGDMPVLTPVELATEPLAEGADIWVSALTSEYEPASADHPVQILTNCTAAAAQYFTSDNPELAVSFKDDALWLGGASAPEGSPENPWKVGADQPEDVLAYTNGNGGLVIEGEGKVVETPWLADKDGITEITIKDPGVELTEGAFDGMGSDDDPIEVNLPDGWTGDFPGEDGSWYGAKVDLTEWPLTVRNVTFSQLGKGQPVTIECDLTGSRPFVLCVNFLEEKSGRKLNSISIQGETYYENLGQQHKTFTWQPTGDLGFDYNSGNVYAEVGISPAQDDAMSEEWPLARIEGESVEFRLCSDWMDARQKIMGFLDDASGRSHTFRRVSPGRYPGFNGVTNTTMGFWIQVNEFCGNEALKWLGLPETGSPSYPISRFYQYAGPLSYSFVRGSSDPNAPLSDNEFGDNLVLRMNKYADVISAKLQDQGLGAVEGFDLPTEAQWEIACRAGTTTKWAYGDETPTTGQVAYGKVINDPWSIYSSSDAGVEPAVFGEPNGWAIFNMHGNVAEYCRDAYAEGGFVGTDADKFVGRTTDEFADRRVLRGGSCTNTADACASSARASIYAGSDRNFPDENLVAGFRLALQMKPTLTARSEVGAFETGSPAPGSPLSPWHVGPNGGEPQAYTNGNGGLVIEGEGEVVEKPWMEDKDGITEITIEDPGVELPPDAFDGMGSEDDPVEVNLPDGWTGALPGPDGSWYGAKAVIKTCPFMIRNVKFQQRYPWNGMVDITADVYGPEANGTELRVSAFNGTTRLRSSSVDGDTFVDLTNGLTKVHIVWNAENDIGIQGFCSTDITIGLHFADCGIVEEKTLWEGNEIVEDWSEPYQPYLGEDGSGGVVQPGAEMRVYLYALNNDEWVSVEIIDGHWDVSRTWVNVQGYDYEVIPDGYVSFVVSEDDVVRRFQTINYWGGLAVVNGDNCCVTKFTYWEHPETFSEKGRIDLRRPIIVAPGESDKITYSQTEWGERLFGTAVNVRFGRYGDETLPVVLPNLTGEGVEDFTYPSEVGRYEFRHDVVETKVSNKKMMRPEVIVAWYVGAGDEKSVYAYDRGDGEIVIEGDGWMKDFSGCGPWGTDITGVTIGNGVHNVGANAFKGCAKMTHAELPESMYEIDNGAFAGATGLETIGCAAELPPEFSGDPFSGVTKEDISVYVPDSAYWDYEDSEDWSPFWTRYKSDNEGFWLEVYSYEGVRHEVTVDGEVRDEGTDYYDEWIDYGSKVVVRAWITDENCLFADGTTQKTFTWNFWSQENGVASEIRPCGADWITLQNALVGNPPADLRDALAYENVNGTNVVTLLRDIATRTRYDSTLVVTNAAVLDLAGRTVTYGNGMLSVIGVGAVDRGLVRGTLQQEMSFGETARAERAAPGWLKIDDSVGGGRITKTAEVFKQLDVADELKVSAVNEVQLNDQQVIIRVNYYGGGVTVLSGSTCVMAGGTIANCYGRYAGGVYNMGTFVLTGGEIAANNVESEPIKAAANELNASYPVQVSGGDGIVNELGATLVITGGKVRDGISNADGTAVPADQEVVVVRQQAQAFEQQVLEPQQQVIEPQQQTFAEPVVEISGGYFGASVAIDRAWLVEGYEAIPNAEFPDYDKKVIQTPPEVAEARTNAWNEIEEAAGLPMTRSDEMDELVEEAREKVRDAYPAEAVEQVLVQYLEKITDRYAKDNPGIPETLTVTGTLDLRSRRELNPGQDVVDGMTYSESTWGWNETPGPVTVTQKNLETGKTMTIVDGEWGSSEGTEMQLVGQNSEEGLGHKLFHAVRGTVLESFVTFVFDGFERGKPSNPWDVGEPDVHVYVDDDPQAEPDGKKLVIDGEGTMSDDPRGADVPWNDRREEITEIFVASGVVLNASAFVGYPNLQRIVFEDPNYRLPSWAMDGYSERIEMGGKIGIRSVGMTWPSDGVYVLAFNGRRRVTAFYNEAGEHMSSLAMAYDYGYNPIYFSTVPRDLINTFPEGTKFEPITDELGDLQGWMVVLQNDIEGTVYLPDNLGWIVIDLNGHDVRGRAGVYDGENLDSIYGRPAFVIEPVPMSGDGEEPLILEFIDSDPDETPDVVGGKGADGNPAGDGAPAIVADGARDGVKVIVSGNATVKGGDAGTGLGWGVDPGHAAPAMNDPAHPIETFEGGQALFGDAAEGEVLAWARCSLGTQLPSAWLRYLPQGITYVNGQFWFWRRVGDRNSAATFDFGEIPLAMLVRNGITSADVVFEPRTIEVDTFKLPVNFSFRFIGSDGGMVKQAVAAKGEKGELEMAAGGNTVLVSVSGKSIFEAVGEYVQEAEPEQPIFRPVIDDPVTPIIVNPDTPVIVIKSAAAAEPAAAPAAEQAAVAAGEESGEATLVWQGIEFTCAESSAFDRWGGAIRMEGGAMRVENCKFTNCFADDYGGAIFAFGLERDSFIAGCRFDSCFVSKGYGYGGAIYASSKIVGHIEQGDAVRLTVSSSTFVGNMAENGGAICTMRDANVDNLVNEQPIELVISQTTFGENTADSDGGAILAEGPVTIKGTAQQGGTVPSVIDPGHLEPFIVGVVRPTSFYRNVAGGSGGAIAMTDVDGEWFVPAKLSVGANVTFSENVASNAYTYALGGAIAHLQPGGTLEVFGAKFADNTAIATGSSDWAYAYGGAVYADVDANVSIDKTRFFGNWAVSENSEAYGGAAAFCAGRVEIVASSFDGNCSASGADYCGGGAVDFLETDALLKNSTFRGSDVEAFEVVDGRLAITNCVIVGNSTSFDDWVDFYACNSPVDVAWSAYGSYSGEGTSPAMFDDEANRNLPDSTVAIYDPAPDAEPWLNPEGYVPAAALGLVQDATDIDSVPYGSRFWGYSMGAYECHTHREMTEGIVVTVDPEEYAWTGLPIEPHSPVHVYDAIVGSNLVEGVDYTLAWADNVDPTDRAVVTAIGTERDYIFTAFTNFWITAYYIDSYKDDETEPYGTEMVGSLSHSNVTAKIAPPEGYAYDPLTSMPTGTVRRYDNECPHLRNGQLTLVLRYYKDDSDDDIPDIYQKKMHLKVVNGWWNGEENGADKTYWVTLYDEEGKWSRDGVGKLGENPTNRAQKVVLPTAGQRPFTDYSASGSWWYLGDSSELAKIATPDGLAVGSSSWPFVIFLYDREQTGGSGRGGGRGGRGDSGETLAEYKLRAGLKITKFAKEGGVSSGEAKASVVDESTGQTIFDELLRCEHVDVLATESLENAEWKVIGSQTTDGEGGWNVNEGETESEQRFYKLQLK